MSENTSKAHEEPKNEAGSVTKYLWIVGAVILLAVGFFGIKAIVSPYEDYKLTLIDAPKEATTGMNTTFTWRVDGVPATINTTTVYYGMESNPGELGKEVKPGETKYTDYVKDFANGKYDIPLQFIGNTIITTPGKYYFRVYSLVKDKNYWTEEYTMDVKQADNKVVVVNVPPQIQANATFSLTWRVDGPIGKTPSTAIYYGEESNPGTLDKTVSPEDAKYKLFTKEFIKGDYNIPLQFIANMKVTSAGTYYYRGYAQINSQHYWTDEMTFEVVTALPTQASEAVSE